MSHSTNEIPRRVKTGFIRVQYLTTLWVIRFRTLTLIDRVINCASTVCHVRSKGMTSHLSITVSVTLGTPDTSGG